MTCWIVSSWGRAGSVLLTQQVRFDLIRMYPLETCKWIKALGQLPPFSVNHSHLIEQLDYIQGCNIIIATRNPKEAALSRFLSDANNYYHKYIDNLQVVDENCKDDYNNAIAQYNNWLKADLVNVDIAQLNHYREVCVAWNETAVTKVPTATVIDYADWKGDLEKSAKIIGIKYRLELKATLWTEMSPTPLIDRVVNKDEVADWLNSQSL